MAKKITQKQKLINANDRIKQLEMSLRFICDDPAGDVAKAEIAKFKCYDLIYNSAPSKYTDLKVFFKRPKTN